MKKKITARMSGICEWFSERIPREISEIIHEGNLKRGSFSGRILGGISGCLEWRKHWMNS